MTLCGLSQSITRAAQSHHMAGIEKQQDTFFRAACVESGLSAIENDSGILGKVPKEFFSWLVRVH